MNYDQKLIENLIMEVKRAKSQLDDLEKYREELEDNEYEEEKSKAENSMNEIQNIIAKFDGGDISMKTELEKIKQVVR